MISGLIELFKKPVTTMMNSASERNVKKEAIIAAVLAAVIALVSVLTTYLGVMKVINKTYKSLEDYNDNLYSWQDEVTKSEFKKMKKEAKEEAFEDIELMEGFFKKFAISLAAIAIIAGILYIIARTVKSPKDYIEMIAITNKAFILYIFGVILNIIFSYIYAPAGIILLLVGIVYAIISLSNAFREMIEVEDADKLAVCSTLVIGIVIAILVIIAVNYLESLLTFSSFSSIL